MRATLRLLLTAACVASLVGDALGQCATATIGKHGEGDPEKLDPVVVDLTNKSHVIVNLHLDRFGCDVVATDVEFCGADNVTLLDTKTVLIHVNEHSKPKGVLNAILYTVPFVGPSETWLNTDKQ